MLNADDLSPVKGSSPSVTKFYNKDPSKEDTSKEDTSKEDTSNIQKSEKGKGIQMYTTFLPILELTF